MRKLRRSRGAELAPEGNEVKDPKFVAVSEINVGDRIYVPNSRHPQEVITIVDDGNFRRIEVDGASWFTPGGTEVRVAND